MTYVVKFYEGLQQVRQIVEKNKELAETIAAHAEDMGYYVSIHEYEDS